MENTFLLTIFYPLTGPQLGGKFPAQVENLLLFI